MKWNHLFDPMLGVRIISDNWYLFQQLVVRNIQARYRGSFLGVLWSFAQPLMMLSVYFIVFAYIFKARWSDDGISATKGGFAIIMFAGMAVFNIFSESVSTSCTVIVQNPNYVKKVIFPLELLPVAQVFSSLVLSSAWFILLLLGDILILRSLSWTMLLLPVTLVPLVLFTCGVCFFTSLLGGLIRDLQHLIVVVMQILFFMTPIFYSMSRVPEKLRWVLYLNPMTIWVEQTRELFLFGRMPDWGLCGLMFVFSFLCFQIGLVCFLQIKKGLVDVI